MEKVNYLMIKANISNYYLPVQFHSWHSKQNFNLKRVTTPKKIQGLDKPITVYQNMGGPTYKNKLIGINIHWTLITLTVNGHNSSVKVHDVQIGCENSIHLCVVTKNPATSGRHHLIIKRWKNKVVPQRQVGMTF